MEENLENYNLIPTLISTGFALFGVLIGVVVTSFINWKIKSKEARLRVLEKIFDRRLNAHENFLKIPKLLRTTITTKEKDQDNVIRTYLGMLATKEMFEEFLGAFYEKVNFNSHWFENDLNKEVWLTQEYLQNINHLIEKIPDENWLVFAEIVKPDFIMFAEKLENKTIEFLQIDIHNIKDKKNIEKFEYPKEEGQKILEQTEFNKKSEEILKLIS